MIEIDDRQNHHFQFFTAKSKINFYMGLLKLFSALLVYKNKSIRMKLKFTFFFLFAFIISVSSQQLSLGNSYITDSGDTVSVPANQRSISPPPSPQSCATSNNIVLPYNQNNGQRGAMFDVTALTNITISCFDVNMATGTTGVSIYYKIGTHVGFTVTPGAWTLIGTANVAGNGVNIPTYIPVNCNVSVSAGCTVAFYITRTTANGAIINYTNGTAVGFVFASNANLQVKDGTGKDYPFGADFTPRRFNGTIYYNLNSNNAGVVTGPLTMCAGSTQTYTFTGNGWTNYVWTVPPGTIITSGQGTNTITILAGSNPGQICVTPSNVCGNGPVACLAVNIAPSPTSTSTSVNVSCFGGNNGSATINPNPVGTYTYAWSPSGGNLQTATGLAAGIYTVTATNSGGCSTTQTITITQPTAITIVSSQVNITCNGGNTGSATVSPSGGSPTYTYAWLPSGGNTATASNLTAGNYTCTITDSHSCTITQSFTITQPPAITSTPSQLNVTCFASCNGSATVVATGGTGTYSYAWAPSGGNAATASALCAGNYTCTISSPVGCTLTQSFTITQPPVITAIPAQVDVTCFASCNGSATVVAAGGTGTYTYAWAPSGGNAATASALCAGNYTCTINSPVGCTITQSFTITQPPVITAIPAQVNVTCFASCNGSATVVAAGGTGTYSYAWAPSGGNAATASALCAGNYTCTISSPVGCTISQSFIITQPTAITLTTSSTPSLCGSPNGTAAVVAAGGTGPYGYSWSPTGGTAATATGLLGGTYVITVTDANACISTATIIVIGATAPTAVITSSTNILCFGGNNGSATVTPAGGNPPYTYSWSPTGGTGSTGTGLTAGVYTVTVTDANACIVTDTVAITEPPILTSTLISSNVLCNGGNSGSATITPVGGNLIYSYSWSPSGGNSAVATGLIAQSYTCTVTDGNGCTTTSSVTITEPSLLTTTSSQVDELCGGSNIGSATVNPSGGVSGYTYSWAPSGGSAASATSLYAGSYTCTITDANGCFITQSFSITEPTTVVASQGAITNVSCFGLSTGAINITQAGGVGPYTYAWLPNVSASNSATGISANSYQVTVTDANGCASTITVTITQPPLLTLSASATPTSVCNGNSVLIGATPAGGAPSYSVVWNPGNLPGNSQNIIPAATTTYSATVTDANGCTANATTTVAVFPYPTATFSANVFSGCAPLCVNFTDNSTIVNPGNIIAWAWDFGDGNTSTTQSPLHCYTTPGNYTVILTAKTADGCENTITMTNYISVFVNPIAAFTASPQPTTIFNGQIFFTNSSSNATSWQWSFGDVQNSTSTIENPNFTYFIADCYQVLLTVTNQDGCVDTVSHPVCLDPDVSIYVPNAFTPNGDNTNEVFIPIGVGLNPDKYEFWVFDRWGNMIFYTTDLNKGWDGKRNGYEDLCQIDTYVWKIAAKDNLGVKHVLTGRVSLIR